MPQNRPQVPLTNIRSKLRHGDKISNDGIVYITNKNVYVQINEWYRT
jgi:hypothetical protein